ncbi:MAG: S1C family serine protease [Anaerolineae bacterium]
MSRERLGCWSLTLIVVLSLLAGGMAGGLLGATAAMWLMGQSKSLALPSATVQAPLPPSPIPTPVSLPSVITLQEESATTEVVKKVGPAVVTVVNLKMPQWDFWDDLTQPRSLGSGVIIDPQGYVVTNNHVVEGNESLSVIMASGDKKDAELIGTDAFSDLAVLHIEGDNFPAAELGDSSQLQPGERVIAIGSALGDFRNTVTSGVISGLERSIAVDESFALEGLIQTDTAINHGNSGGPLVNLQGQVIGINTLIIRGDNYSRDAAEGLGFATPSDTVHLVAEQLISKGRVSRPFLGISHQEVTPRLAAYYNLAVNQGILVLQVAPATPASQAGLKAGDVIVAISGDPIDPENPFLNVLMRHQVDETVTLNVNRFGHELALEVTLEERPY